jgi:hypothetical protein
MTRAATYDELTAKLREAREEAAAYREALECIAVSNPYDKDGDCRDCEHRADYPHGYRCLLDSLISRAREAIGP